MHTGPRNLILAAPLLIARVISHVSRFFLTQPDIILSRDPLAMWLKLTLMDPLGQGREGWLSSWVSLSSTTVHFSTMLRIHINLIRIRPKILIRIRIQAVT